MERESRSVLLFVSYEIRGESCFLLCFCCWCVWLLRKSRSAFEARYQSAMDGSLSLLRPSRVSTLVRFRCWIRGCCKTIESATSTEDPTRTDDQRLFARPCGVHWLGPKGQFIFHPAGGGVLPRWPQFTQALRGGRIFLFGSRNLDLFWFFFLALVLVSRLGCLSLSPSIPLRGDPLKEGPGGACHPRSVGKIMTFEDRRET